MSRKKVTVAGAGDVGATCAQRLAERDADVVLVDALEGLAGGRALDINQAGALSGYEPRVVGTGDYEETAGSDVCVIVAERPGTPGQSHMEIVESAASRLAERSPGSILIVAADPLAAMCHVALDASGFPRQRVVGMGGIVDSARLCTLLAWELGVSLHDVSALVVGGEGDSMVPLVGCTSVAGVPVRRLVDPTRLGEIVQRVREGAAEVEGMLGQRAAPYCPSAGVADMADSILFDRMRVVSCAALCQGEYGIRDLFIGVPCRLGANGIEEIVEFELADDELERLRAAADSARERVAEVTKLRGR